ncbi:Arsenite oxidase subunit AioB [Meiothermus luteus]|jgi:Rieske Fe-S protein|uniref:Arsenite oxidase subunit AioB n=1 Tax=Meiothermus luteus TaxID=2026184 RepID=A0A399ERY8_9DEIN|nr:ubiquinol-cytochrome c reductase iron-sulfur subunit [Meiothermus luteus]RIH86728.1 Arsenite oxidase subunit AioB [Meiothermus luteus]RMH54179.1 MAG: ubiquinol-cytochrome c reductase iron-sulfur subunit [Deinococcota bacterium]
MSPPNPKKPHLDRRDLLWILPSLVTGGFFGWLAWRTYVIHFTKAKVREPLWRAGPRLRAAALDELPSVWRFRYFEYRYADSPLRAVVIRLPQPVSGGLSVGEAHFLALSRICTHQGCTVNFVDNPELGAIAYNYRTDHPFLGCPCHFGAYEPLQAGKAVYGPPQFPLPRLRLEEEGGVLYATGLEVPFRPLER